MRQLLLRLRPADATQGVFLVFLGLLLSGGVLASWLRQPALLLPALALVGVVLVLTEWRWLYYALFLTLPFSLEIPLTGGLMMDVPSEPLLLALTATVPVALLLGRGSLGQLSRREWQHPLLVLLALLLLWSAFDIAFSVDKIKSFKYVLAKVWYLTPFVLGTLLLVRRPADFWRVAACYVAGAAVYFVSEDNFMRFAPDFEKTIWHGNDFEAHLESTYKLQEVSGMERLYRWVAAARMVADKPATGSGPSTFYPEYKRYTITGFRTYVSDNPEHSTTHNYFLLLLAEQGVPGFLLFCLLLSTALLTAERLYHRSLPYPEVHRVVLAVSLSLVIILFHLFLNELVEVDKIGSVLLVSLAMLVRAGSWLEEVRG